MPLDISGEISKYVGVLIVFAVGVSIGGYAVSLAANATGLGLLSSVLVGTVIGAGLLMLLVRAFF